MNIKDIIQTLNEFRGRRFLIVIGVWYLVYIGKVQQLYALYVTLAYFVIDIVEKITIHKSEEEGKNGKPIDPKE